jgi:hypothetical protein
MSMLGNVTFSNEHDNGGHFAAYEKPEALVSDVKQMFAKGSKAFGVVANKTGYASAKE